MKKLYLLVSMSVLCSGQGQLPDSFKFEPASDDYRTTLIDQLQRFEACNGDEACIAQLKLLQQTVLIKFCDNKVHIENNSDADVIVSVENKNK